MAQIAMNDVLKFMNEEAGEIVILDATNTTLKRRNWLRQIVDRDIKGYAGGILWVESICNDEKILEASIREVKAKHPDYAGQDPEDAVRDFKARIEQYKKVYVPVNEGNVDEGSHIKLVDCGTSILMRKVSGALYSKLAGFLMNLRPMHRVSLF